MADREYFEIETEDGTKLKFKYTKITNAQFKELEDLKLKMSDGLSLRQTSQLYDDIMKKSAQFYFGINGEFDKLKREDLGFALEAASYRTLYGRPFLSRSSQTMQGSAAESASSAPQPPAS